jgi:hypothetical protein
MIHWGINAQFASTQPVFGDHVRPGLLAVILAVLAGLVAAEPPRRPKSTHPIIGTWAFMVPDTDCEETYYMRRDGTSLVTSGEEVSESVYQIDDELSAKGFYKSTDKLVKDNGKMDCSGEVMKVGNEVTNYIRFHPSGDMIIICRNESLDACFGPLHRVQGQNS